MRIMIDTNVLLSALIFNSTKLAELLEHIIGTRSLVLCSYVIEESKIVIGRKTPNYLQAFDIFISEISFEYFPTPVDLTGVPCIRDPQDLPIIASAVAAKVDVLITGDKDFAELIIPNLEILTPSEFIDKYMSL